MMSSGPSDDADVTQVIVADRSPGLRSAAIGRRLGRYLVISELGQGGMGLVLRAYDPKLLREVALKVLKTDALSEEARARFIREARAMAQLSHPNVVAIYDVDLATSANGGEVVLAMEYVPGQTLRQWCNEATRPWDTIIEAYRAAGRGLVAAHVRGLLHRDFKPDNVLVTPRADGSLWIKVGDFGLATAADRSIVQTVGEVEPSGSGSLSDDLTEEGTVVGTPRYMAPEQHTASTLSAAADQYSFCLALWEALCGEYPFELDELAGQKMAGPPPWPRGNAVPTRIVEALQRGLQPTPQRRWPDVATLLEALAPKAGAGRLRRGVMLGSIALVGIGASAWAARDDAAQVCSGAEQQLEATWSPARRDALREAMVDHGPPWARPVFEGLAQRLDAYRETWIRTHTSACEATTIRGEQSPAAMDLRMACLDRARVHLAATVRVLEEADAETLQRAFDVIDELPPLHRCSDLQALEAEVPPPAAGARAAVDEARKSIASARALREGGRYEASRSAIFEARERARDVGYEPVLTEVALEDGLTLHRLGRSGEAIARLHEAAQMGARLGQWELVAETATHLVAVAGRGSGRPNEGLAYSNYAAGLVERTQREDLRARLRNNVAVVRHTLGHHEEAIDEFRALLEHYASLSPRDPLNVAGAHNNLGLALTDDSRTEEAITHFTAAIAGFSEVLGPGHPVVAGVRSNLGSALDRMDQVPAARRAFEQALSIYTATLGPDHPATVSAREDIAIVLARQGHLEEAETEGRAVLEIHRRTLPSDHPKIAFAHANLSATLADARKLEEAQEQIEMALDAVERWYGREHPDYGGFLLNLGRIQEDRDRLADAERTYRESLRHTIAALGSEHDLVARVRFSLGRLLLRTERAAEAVPHLEDCWSILQERTPAPAQQVDAAFALAQALAQRGGDEERIEALSQNALNVAREHDLGGTDVIERWLEERR